MANRNDRGPSPRAFAAWIPARDIAEKLKALGEFNAAIGALHRRLEVGLVKSAAAHGSAAKKPADEGPFYIPLAHWKDANGIVVSDLWQTGQIAIWSWWTGGGEKIEYDYFDVRFDPAGIDEMLQNASAVRELGSDALEIEHDKLPQKLTAAEFANWIPATQAYQQVITAYAGSLQATAYVLGTALTVGNLRSGADYFGVEGKGKPTGTIEIGTTHWVDAGDLAFANVFWETGILKVKESVGGLSTPRSAVLVFGGVRFEGEGLKKILAAAPNSPGMAKVKRNANSFT